MRIFISYSSRYANVCERLRLALIAAGDNVFVDRSELEPGRPFDKTLREGIEKCDLFIFLVSPESVAPHSYALAELSMVQARWEHPGGRVLPVVVAPTPKEAIPPYLSAVTVFQPQGDVVAETLHEVDKLRRRGWGRFATIAVVLLLAVAVGAGVFFKRWRAEEARAEQFASVAKQLCDSGDHALAWERYEEAVARYPGRLSLRRERENCGMRWLREIRVQQGKQTFTDIVNRVRPVFIEGAASADASRAADLEAHAGWGDFLRSREGASEMYPARRYRKALELDPTNVYAHAMLGHWTMVTHGSIDDARKHFTAALASGRERAYVRRMQFAAMLYYDDLAGQLESARVANEMRLAGEAVDPEIKNRLWSYVYYAGLSTGQRADFLAALRGDEHVTTFRWLYPEDQVRPDRRRLWNFHLASLEEAAGQKAAARSRFESLRDELQRERSGGRMLDETIAAIKRLEGP